MQRILVGLDGSDVSGDALRWAMTLARRIDAEVIATHAWQTDETELPAWRIDELTESAQRDLETWTRPLVGSDTTHRIVLRHGNPRNEIPDLAAAESADLVVVGSRGRGGFLGLHLGSVAHGLAHVTRIPLAIVPAGGGQADFRRLIVGVDGSPGSRAAACWGADLTEQCAAEAVAVHAAPVADARIPDDWVDVLEKSADTKRRAVEGSPVIGLTDAAEDEHADLIVVGMRGLGTFTGLRLGGHAVQLLHRSRLPVVLVPVEYAP